MFTAYIFITIFTVAANIYAAAVDFRRPQWVLENITKWGGRHSWLFTLGALKAAGAVGLLVSIAVPLVGVAAAIGLVLFFVGAIAVVICARWYAHLAWPSTYLLLAVGSLALRVAVSSNNNGCSKIFQEMSKHSSVKRHHCGRGVSKPHKKEINQEN